MLDRAAITDAIRFWERGRIAYNGLLLAVVLATAGSSVGSLFAPVTAIGLLSLAVLANIVYSIAYPVDLFVQMSAYRDAWRHHRWVLLAVGMVLAAGLTFLATLAILSPILSTSPL